MMGVCWRAFKGLRWMLVAPRVRPPLRIEAVKYSFARPDATRDWSMALKNTGFPVLNDSHGTNFSLVSKASQC